MKITKVTGNKKDYLELLLLADEQEDMIDKYLEFGEMFVLEDNGVKAECVVTKEDEGIYELKNIAVDPKSQRKGYGKQLIEFAFHNYPDCKKMLVGTGDVPSTVHFYTSCGFKIVDSEDVVKATEVPIGGYGIFLWETYSTLLKNSCNLGVCGLEKISCGVFSS